MLRSIHLLLITILLTLSAHAEIQTSLPDTNSIDSALAPLEAELAWTTPAPSKSKLIEEKHLEPAPNSTIEVRNVPTIDPFQKKSFILQSRTYRSHTIKQFHLRI